MIEYRFYPEGEFPFTPEWYQEREHAPHLEQPVHHGRLNAARQMVEILVAEYRQDIHSIVDLGAGDGGLLSTLGSLEIPVWGYDLMPVNCEYAREHRGMQVELVDFTARSDALKWGDLAICTETLEHLDDPHALVRRIGRHCKYLVASSPNGETPESHDAVHVWGWDVDGYRRLMEQARFEVVSHTVVGQFQIVGCVRR